MSRAVPVYRDHKNSKHNGTVRFIRTQQTQTFSRLLFVQHVPFFIIPSISDSTVHINLARHPISMMQSWWYYKVDPTVRPFGRAEATMLERKASPCGCHNITYEECVLTAPQRQCEKENLQLMTVSLIYFCGPEDSCKANTEERYQKALYRLKNEYLFVGITEQIGRASCRERVL